MKNSYSNILILNRKKIKINIFNIFYLMVILLSNIFYFDIFKIFKKITKKG